MSRHTSFDFDRYLKSSAATNTGLIAQQFASAGKATSSVEEDAEKQPVFGSRHEAIAYLQAEKYRPHHALRTHPVHAAPKRPYGNHIASVVRSVNGKEVREVLHATKGWKRLFY